MNDSFLAVCIITVSHILLCLGPPSPENVVVARIDSTTIAVSWRKFTLVELKGLANYVLSYSLVIPSRKRQQFRGAVNASWTENSVFLTNLQPGAQYELTVHTVTSGGVSGMPEQLVIIQ